MALSACSGRHVVPAPSGDLETAIASERFAIAADPGDMAAQVRLARLYERADRPGGALRHFEIVYTAGKIASPDRLRLAALYRTQLAGIEEILPLELPAWPGRHAWHLFVVRLDVERARLSRADFMAGLKERGVGTGIHFRAVHEHRYYRERAEALRAPLPATEWNSERIVSLPLFPEMTPDDVERVVGAIREVLA